ncbi:hypothetical protein A3D66_01980 [Candidatus Kaiserbacteria bacterium RIFCSPHIGHO2_02_FULL_50_9]|uniref:DUF5698 domain-containing protein n=1 Tax=Candidatus Kaiserbacteria bacterium RIFCSPLOWO2_01_FULL_51_21 TaxID=1798508 RepID=A0A1F6EDR8_9BACT|nr:MAG: hypothetical protein A3D66_01980 [Candidatus Kaiserbacteria bacterium RIFCSPHIGHO2_02_FULL_50_9]OGG71757.1 MAG: hypothetical protein A3A35_02040 [Candidatus Kaiserbacteria bacterium RIFCSPLOWO2_01_FULL_51_21]
MLIIFLIGMAEMVLSTLWTKYVQEKSVVGSTAVTMVHVFVWYYVLRTVIDQIDNIGIVVAYALGCGIGNVAAHYFGEYSKKKLAIRRRKKSKTTQDGVSIPAVPNLLAHESH